MPARRRFQNSESDDNFSVLIDSGVQPIVDQSLDADEQKKYAAQPNTFGSFAVPNLTKWSSSIGTFLQQQLQQGGYADQAPLHENNNQSAIGEDLLNFPDFESEEIVVMTARDRTAEFHNAIRSLQGRNIARAVNIKDPKKATQMQSYSEFMMHAKHIGKNIASTYSKLEKLTLCECWMGARPVSHSF